MSTQTPQFASGPNHSQPGDALGRNTFAARAVAAVITVAKEFLACFRSVKLAIILLSLLAIATLVGVLMPQEGLVELADMKRQYGTNFRMLRAMGLFTVYSSPWFIALQVLFFFNLLIGSFQWLRPAYLAATQRLFLSIPQIQKTQQRFEIPLASDHGTLGSSESAISDWLKKHRYHVFKNPLNTAEWYATKGNWSRFGPATAHIGILLLLIASVYGTFTGFKAQKLANPQSSFNFSQLDFFKPNIQENVWLGKTPDWTVKVNDFQVHYYPNDPKTVQQYFADLSVSDSNGKLMKRETISVNHPLQLGDLTIYQASFNPTGKVLTEINGKPTALKVDTQFEDRKVSMMDVGDGRVLIAFPFIVQQDPGADANKLVVFMKTPNGFLGAGPNKMPENLRLREGQEGSIGGVQVKFLHPEFATGLQIKKAPEVPLMYLAYLIIGIGTVMCIFSQRMLWFGLDKSPQTSDSDAPDSREPDNAGKSNVRAHNAKLHIAFKTNKGRLSFLKELQTLQTALQPTQAG